MVEFNGLNMRDKKLLLVTINWLVFFILLLCLGNLFTSLILASYHPNSPRTPYVNAFAVIWLVSTVSTLLLGLIISSKISKKTSFKKLKKIVAFVYLLLLMFAAVTLISVQRIPTYSIQSIDNGNTQYHVPSVFLRSNHDNRNALRLWMCLDDLTGYYDTRTNYCKIQEVNLSRSLSVQSIANANHSNFFKQSNEFNIDADQLDLGPGAEAYRVPGNSRLDWYSVYTSWPDSENSLIDRLIRFQINESNELARFVHCL
ncbi:MAG: hypothetical protein AAFY72_09840 [Cyanobacteria bacterium J06649_4]